MASNNLAKGLKRSALALALGLCFVGAAIAAETGGLRITITGNGGTPLAGATVKVSSPASLISKTGVTAADGTVNLNGLDPATNYKIEVIASGYSDFSANNIAVVSGKNLSVGYSLGTTTLDTVVVTGASLAAVDTTSATVGTTLTLDMVEALPTGRNYQSYLQLVPGVKPSSGGNPSSKSGVNYSDIGGAVGTSTDNAYFLDGVDVTDPLTGTFGSNFNSEIIQEQQVLTGGVPAEYAGGSGLISKVVTKSGGDEFHGSINYYLQNDNLVAKDKHATSAGFNTYDTAVTLGGPIIKEKLWFFGSYQKKSREDDVVNPATGDVMRSVSNDARYAFLKATWQITDNDRLTGTYFSDPTEISGSNSSGTLNNRDTAREQGGDNYKLEYSHDWDNFRVSAYGFRHEAQLSTLAADQSTLNTVTFRTAAGSTLAQRSLGGAGGNTETWRNRDEFGISGEYWLDTDHGSHAFKAGFTSSENTYKRNATVTGDGSTYTSIATQYAGVTYSDLTGSWTTKPFSNDDRARVITAINASPNKAYFLGLLDANHDGVLDVAEISAAQFSSTAGNPNGQINAYRSLRTTDAPYAVTSKGKTFFLQDTWTLDKWTVNAGVRAEQWAHHASDGSELFTFDWKLAPRLSVVYDLAGDGRSKVWGFFGRYYDPIRNDMTNFAGNLSGPVNEEQIYLGNQWLTYRVRGGAVVLDSIFSPSTKTPFTDEIMVGYATTFGRDMSLSVTYTNRTTNDVFEDYDLAVYSDPNGDGADGVAFPGSPFYLPYSYFGLSQEQIAKVQAHDINYVLGTLAGGKRRYQGFEVSLQKQKSNNWMGMVSYTHNIASGNTNSDGNADLQGDLIFLDPRAPNVWGPQAGNIEHQFKAFGTYFTPFGLEVSGVFNWNSGYLYTASTGLYGRAVPPSDAPYEYGGIISDWLSAGYMGAEKAPSYYTFDVRLKYAKDLSIGKVELFLDIFNILDKQSATGAVNAVGGTGQYAFGDANAWVAPRRAYLGVRYSF